jgi:hypothetical protein
MLNHHSNIYVYTYTRIKLPSVFNLKQLFILLALLTAISSFLYLIKSLSAYKTNQTIKLV